jgi:hypothetical protein
VVEHSEHQRITAAGWAYRAKNSGWVIYLDPQTGIWHTRSEAMFIIGMRSSGKTGDIQESNRL